MRARRRFFILDMDFWLVGDVCLANTLLALAICEDRLVMWLVYRFPSGDSHDLTDVVNKQTPPNAPLTWFVFSFS